MIIVADASPINYLVQLECDQLLSRIYERVLIPRAVMLELSHRHAPRAVAAWAATPPQWVEVCTVAMKSDALLERLDDGEREAILLAEERNAFALLMDEQRGRREALRRGLRVTGTLGVLVNATRLGLADGHALYVRLVSETTFQASSHLKAQFASMFAKLKQED